MTRDSHNRALPKAFAIRLVVIGIHINGLIIRFIALNYEDVVDRLPLVDLILEGDLVRYFLGRGRPLQDTIPKTIHALVGKLVFKVCCIVCYTSSNGRGWTHSGT